MTQVIVVDLDGTLCDVRWRQHLAQAKEWDQFHEGIPYDKPHDDVVTAVRALHTAGLELIGCTGRPEYTRIATEWWLVKHDIPLDCVLMRPAFDYRPDVVVKIETLKQWLKETEKQVLFVLEDRDCMVSAWRSAGFNCWQVRNGEY